MNMTGPAYRSVGKRIPVARPPRRSDPETSTGGARRASRHKPKNHDRFRKSFRFVRFRRGSRSGPAGGGILHVIPQSPEKPRKTNPGLPDERGQDDLRIRRRRQQTNQKRNDHPQAGRPRPGGDHIRAVEPRSATMARKIRCRHGQSSGQRHCGRRPSRPVGTVRTGAP